MSLTGAGVFVKISMTDITIHKTVVRPGRRTYFALT